MGALEKLAELIKNKNLIEEQISSIIERPAFPGHIGEFIASHIFDIALHESAIKKGSDGKFNSGTLMGRSVNVKLYSKQSGILDLNLQFPSEYYLVLTGPKSFAVSSRGQYKPMIINSVFLFETTKLFDELKQRGVKIGIAASLTREQWNKAEIYPNQTNNILILSNEQQNQLALFS